MGPSVRVKRRHPYASIQDEDRFRPEQLQDDQVETGRRALSEPSAALSPSAASGSLHPSVPPHDPSHLSPNSPSFRRDMSRVNRLARRSSVSYRSFATDLESNPSDSPQVGRLDSAPVRETIYEGTSTDAAGPHAHRAHAPRVSRVRSALSSSPSRTGDESDSDYDSEDEDRIMEDDEHHHDDDVVDHLDVIDPQFSTIATLTNTANAILLPPLSFYSRKPVVTLPSRSARDIEGASTHTASTDELDRHVHDVLKRKNKFRRVMKGVWAFLKTPLGIAFGIYGFLVVFWGSALVFFLAKWIDLNNQSTQDFWVEICEQILNGLFCLTGIGLIPWRIVDTYRMIKIWYYKRRTRKLRKKAGLPELYDKDDLPDPMFDPNYVHVLTDKQHYELHHQQKLFMKSQTWYRPHGTETHRAFPINRALLICLFNDGNSVFQCLLAACMWSMNRFDRPSWTTALLIPLAFGCGITSGVLIWRGGKKTKRTERVEERLRRVLEMEEAEHVVPPESMLAKLQDAITRRTIISKLPERNRSEPSEKPVENVAGVPNGTRNPGDYASTVTSSVRSPGIRIEEEMVVPPSS